MLSTPSKQDFTQEIKMSLDSGASRTEKGRKQISQEKQSKVPWGLREGNCPSQLEANSLLENLLQCLHSSLPGRQRGSLVDLWSFHQVL